MIWRIDFEFVCRNGGCPDFDRPKFHTQWERNGMIAEPGNMACSGCGRYLYLSHRTVVPLTTNREARNG